MTDKVNKVSEGNTVPHSKNSKKRYRSVCFTVFPKDDSYARTSHLAQAPAEALRPLKVNEGKKYVKYMIYQPETCPTTGKTHLQGYMILNRPLTLGMVKYVLGDDSAHVEERRGTHEEAIAYCEKEESHCGDIYEYGDRKECGQGARTDLLDIKKKIEEKVPISSLYNTHFVQMIRYGKGIQSARYHMIERRREKTLVILIWGETGVGKSSLVRKFTGEDYYTKDNSHWWDGYAGEEHVIIDEFNHGNFTREYLLQLFDRYPFRIQYKGGYCEFNSKVIWLTSNYDPKEWLDETVGMKRRIDLIVHLGGTANRQPPHTATSALESSTADASLKITALIAGLRKEAGSP